MQPAWSNTGNLSDSRVVVDGKFFRCAGRKFYPKGLAYGPLRSESGSGFPSPDTAKSDFELINRLGANTLRVYEIPPRWFLDLAQVHGLKLLVDVPWNKHLCVLESTATRNDAIEQVKQAAQALANHPAIFALSVVNEIPADLVRWSGARKTSEFLDELVRAAKAVDPELLCTFANFPPTEFLQCEEIDFVCFNLYLHHRRPLENYLARLQMLADTKPLLIGECGIDSLSEGTDDQAEILPWTIEAVFRSGAAGIALFSFTDDWWKDGRPVTQWAFGLCQSDRTPKPAWEKVRAAFRTAPYFAPYRYHSVSIVVASYNGANTLLTCLQSLLQLNYPDYEVILVDDGSTDHTSQIASLFPRVRTVRHPQNRGLSAARNSGIQAARGEIIAFTDADCRADEDWLHYLVGDLAQSNFAGMGGHNLLPEDDSSVAAAVMVSPGGPAHVMLSDRLAEHVPGCNMAFYRWALDAIGGFDARYRRAGDDVDVCWRMQAKGFRIGFCPGGFVWHYRRNTIRAYLNQQRGYGDAEAMLEQQHPENFNPFGGSRWRGRIYSPAHMGVRLRAPVIYHGTFGSSLFQSLYAPETDLTLVLATSLEFHILLTLPLLVLSTVATPLLTLGLASFLFSVGMCVIAALQADLPHSRKRGWSRPLIALLFFLQPIVRGWARHRRHWTGQNAALETRETLASLLLEDHQGSLHQRSFWCEHGIDRFAFVQQLLETLDQLQWPNKPDGGWNRFDVEVYGSLWAKLQVTTAVEHHTGGRVSLRCRIRPQWTSLAQALFWFSVAVVILWIGTTPSLRPWSWLAILILPFIVWHFARAKAALQRVFVVLLNQIAKEHSWIPIRD